MFTQPLMYKKIRQHKNAHQQYVERLLTEGDISKQQVGGWAPGVCRATASCGMTGGCKAAHVWLLFVYQGKER